MKQIIDSKNDKLYAEKAAQNHWFTPEVADMMNKIITEKWFVREVIYPKEVPRCEIFDYNGCMRLYHNKARFFALEGEKLNTEAGECCNLHVDFFSADKIIIQQRDDAAFDHWSNSDPFELTSLWPTRQLVIAADHKDKRLIAFAPIFVVCTPEFHSTSDFGKFYKFAAEFEVYRHHTEKYLDKAIYSDAQSFLKNSCDLLNWLKNHCY